MTTKTAAYRKRVRQALKAGKIYLALTADDLCSFEKDEFICCAFELAEHHGHISKAMAFEAKMVIMNRIGRWCTACNWLRDTIGDEAVEEAGEVAVQEWRHRWIDALIEEFSEDEELTDKEWKKIDRKIMKLPGMLRTHDSYFMSEGDHGETYIKFMSDNGITDNHNGRTFTTYMRSKGYVVDSTRDRSMSVKTADLIKEFSK